MSLILICESAVFNTTVEGSFLALPLQAVIAWVVDFHLVSRYSTDHGHCYDPQYQLGPWAATWPPLTQ